MAFKKKKKKKSRQNGAFWAEYCVEEGKRNGRE